MAPQLPSDVDVAMGLAIEIPRVRSEAEVVDELLELDGKEILELGCGAAEMTRALARAGRDRRILALDIDRVQHARNLAAGAPPGLRFELGGAEAIPAADASQDVVLLLKSLHHVPVEAMERALAEIARVLRPGGLAYVSEPIFRGPFNDILRLFHDEEAVRRAAFRAILHAVDNGLFELRSRTFFRAPRRFDSFAEFERQVIGATHQDHRLSPELHARVRAAFEAHADPGGAALFEPPVRVDLLSVPSR